MYKLRYSLRLFSMPWWLTVSLVESVFLLVFIDAGSSAGVQVPQTQISAKMYYLFSFESCVVIEDNYSTVHRGAVVNAEICVICRYDVPMALLYVRKWTIEYLSFA
jgi:hypothetical protein